MQGHNFDMMTGRPLTRRGREILAARRRAARRRRMAGVAASVALGALIGGTLAAAMATPLLGIPQMLRRRAEMPAVAWGADAAEAGASGDPAFARTGLVPVTWSLIDGDARAAANREAIREDLLSMEPSPASPLYEWNVLPYPVSAGDDPEEIVALVDEVLCEDPTLSVCVNGQCVSVGVGYARYSVPAYAGDDTAEDNREQREAVLRALDEVVGEALDGVAGGDLRGQVLGAYRAVARRSTYSDDVGDTAHANDIYGALIEGESKCYGVAGALKAALDRLGIPSFMASGYVDSDPSLRHAWVMVWLYDGWWACDVTRGQGAAAPDGPAWQDPSSMYWLRAMTPWRVYREECGAFLDDDAERLKEAYEGLMGSDGDPRIPGSSVGGGLAGLSATAEAGGLAGGVPGSG